MLVHVFHIFSIVPRVLKQVELAVGQKENPKGGQGKMVPFTNFFLVFDPKPTWFGDGDLSPTRL